MNALSRCKQSPFEITTSDNRLVQGRLHDGVLTIDLEAREGIWYPEEHDGPGLKVQAFAEAGRTPQIPGPIIRAAEGTEIRIAVRNAIAGVTLVMHGLHARVRRPVRVAGFKSGARNTNEGTFQMQAKSLCQQ